MVIWYQSIAQKMPFAPCCLLNRVKNAFSIAFKDPESVSNQQDRNPRESWKSGCWIRHWSIVWDLSVHVVCLQLGNRVLSLFEGCGSSLCEGDGSMRYFLIVTSTPKHYPDLLASVTLVIDLRSLYLCLSRLSEKTDFFVLGFQASSMLPGMP